MVAAVIPLVFRRIWFGPREMPTAYHAYGDSWVRHNGGVLVNHGYGSLPTSMVNQEAFDAVGTTHAPNPGGAKAASVVQVQQADIASYELLWAWGGVYVNCDLEARRPLGDLLKPGVFHMAWEVPDTYPSNAFMACPARHPFLEVVLDLLPRRMAQFDRQSINEQTGPHLLRQALAEYGGSDVTVFPQHWFMPYLPGEMHREGGDWPEAYAEHHWGHQTPDDRLWGVL